MLAHLKRKKSCQCFTHSAIQSFWSYLVIYGEYIIIAKLSNNVEIVFDQAPFRVECYWVELKGQMLDWKSSLMKAKQVPTRFCTRQTADSASTIKVKLSNNQLSNTSDQAFIFQLRRNTSKSEMIRLQLSKYQIINYEKIYIAWCVVNCASSQADYFNLSGEFQLCGLFQVQDYHR